MGESLFLMECPREPSALIHASENAREVSRWLVLSFTTCLEDSTGTGISTVTVSILTVSIYSIRMLSELARITGGDGSEGLAVRHALSSMTASSVIREKILFICQRFLYSGIASKHGHPLMNS